MTEKLNENKDSFKKVHSIEKIRAKLKDVTSKNDPSNSVIKKEDKYWADWLEEKPSQEIEKRDTPEMNFDFVQELFPETQAEIKDFEVRIEDNFLASNNESFTANYETFESDKLDIILIPLTKETDKLIFQGWLLKKSEKGLGEPNIVMKFTPQEIKIRQIGHPNNFLIYPVKNYRSLPPETYLQYLFKRFFEKFKNNLYDQELINFLNVCLKKIRK